MSSVHRIFSRRDRKQHHHDRDKSQDPNHRRLFSHHGKTEPEPESEPDHLGGLFTLSEDAKKKPFKEEDKKKVKGTLERLRHFGYDFLVEANVEYALWAYSGDAEAAFRYLVLLQDTVEGIVKPYDPDTKLQGAVNRDSVTCYLDALLFAMFARLDSFEAMLYDNFEDLPRRKLAGLLRIWVNMLRTGRLITTDITAYLQSALAECGWPEAAKLKQQDPSEAFTFITGQLELPLLTLKMDLYHTGKEDPQDDHKFVNERLLEVAIPDEPADGADAITLEDCLEHYFNNRIEVKRHLEARRRNTLSKAEQAAPSVPEPEKESGMHVEVAELESRPDTPIVQTPVAETPAQTKNPVEKLRPGTGRKRADSIFSQRKVELTGIDPDKFQETTDDPTAIQDARGRKLSTRTEVLMPAWQFFKLLPWYTDHLPTSDAQVAAHFSKKRPMLGICLKRYTVSYSGQASRRSTYVDIPLEIGVPNFVSDDNMEEDGPLVGNFRLMLQSVVCHRGVSVNSGHYITLCRGKASNAQRQNGPSERHDSQGDIFEEMEDPWMRFDDLARERVSFVNIHEALKQETPYLLFYQVVPIGDDGHSIHDLPSYTEATSTSRSGSEGAPLEKPYLQDLTPAGSEASLSHTNSIQQTESETSQTRQKTDAADFAVSSTRTSLDAGTMLADDKKRGRSSFSLSTDGRRRSIAFDESSFAGSVSGGSTSTRTDPATNSVPSTPVEEKSGGFLSIASSKFGGSRRGSKMSKNNSSNASRSRPSSAGPADSLSSNSSRFSLNMTKLTQRMSNTANRGESAAGPNQQPPTPAIQPSEHVATELAGQTDAEPDRASTPKNSGAGTTGSGDGESIATARPGPKERRELRGVRRKDRGGGGAGAAGGEERDCRVM
ncbi:cysteine proteinase [Hortaea werneckii]|nr:cysteine proteinase [Hortaea werneckii]KAI7609045.1 cysteine proteinase [Hortaea werneckii]KAI7619082.1 cysteine proteinase [Hortaea werneckii]KAI7700079.1 cysteine proteinase [Hortaea werneckii]